MQQIRAGRQLAQGGERGQAGGAQPRAAPRSATRPGSLLTLLTLLTAAFCFLVLHFFSLNPTEIHPRGKPQQPRGAGAASPSPALCTRLSVARRKVFIIINNYFCTSIAPAFPEFSTILPVLPPFLPVSKRQSLRADKDRKAPPSPCVKQTNKGTNKSYVSQQREAPPGCGLAALGSRLAKGTAASPCEGPSPEGGLLQMLLKAAAPPPLPKILPPPGGCGAGTGGAPG